MSFYPPYFSVLQASLTTNTENHDTPNHDTPNPVTPTPPPPVTSPIHSEQLELQKLNIAITLCASQLSVPDE